MKALLPTKLSQTVVALVALGSLLLVGGGALAATFMEDAPVVLLWAGMIVAAVFIVGYVVTMGVGDPYAQKRHRAD